MNTTATQTSAKTPFTQGKEAFGAGAGRFDNPFNHLRDEHAEWESGFDNAFGSTVVKPKGNTYSLDVYKALVVLARAFKDSNYSSAAEELEAMAERGPDVWRGMGRLSNSDVLHLASARLAEMGRLADKM